MADVRRKNPAARHRPRCGRPGTPPMAGGRPLLARSGRVFSVRFFVSRFSGSPPVRFASATTPYQVPGERARKSNVLVVLIPVLIFDGDLRAVRNFQLQGAGTDPAGPASRVPPWVVGARLADPGVIWSPCRYSTATSAPSAIFNSRAQVLTRLVPPPGCPPG